MNILAHGRATQPTSYAMITTPYDITTNEGVRQSTPQSATQITTPPTFSGITGVTPKTDGSFNIQWGSVTSVNNPFEFQIFVSPGVVSAATLFSLPAAELSESGTTNKDIFKLSDHSTYFVNGQTYTFGVRCKDGVQNQNTNLSILTSTAIASGNLPALLQNEVAKLDASIKGLGGGVQMELVAQTLSMDVLIEEVIP